MMALSTNDSSAGMTAADTLVPIRVAGQREVLGRYAAGEGIDAITATSGFTRDQVSDMVAQLARFDRGRARQLVRQYDEAHRPAVSPQTPPRPATPGPAPARPAAAKETSTMDTPNSDGVEALLAAAEKSGVGKPMRLAKKIRDLIDDLKPLMDASEKERVLIASISVLRRQLDSTLLELKELRGGRPTPTTAAVVPDKQIRQWAHDNQEPCPNTGRLPAEVREKYAKAHA